MDVKTLKALGNEFYSKGVGNDLKAAKETYVTFLNTAKESPSVAKLIFNDSLVASRDMFFKTARHNAAICGSDASIKEAVKKDSNVKDFITVLKSDKDVKALEKKLKESINNLYKRTKSIREQAVLNENGNVSLSALKDKRSKNFLTRFFG